MRKKNYKGRVVKRSVPKCCDICRTYDPIMTAYADLLSQRDEYRSEDSSHDGISPIRESYMVSNFMDAYDRCSTDKIMGIYGSYHIDLDNPDVMAVCCLFHFVCCN